MTYAHATWIAQANAGDRLKTDTAPLGRCNQCHRTTHDPLEVGGMCGLLFDDMECMGRFRAIRTSGTKGGRS